jgi:hypothetical protein
MRIIERFREYFENISQMNESKTGRCQHVIG